ncbi:MAG: hypothetical protein PHQ12_13135 [Chthoniobacteraceae bacterium]|nr:hypothetical protein [Chthoniobacteraceae bacterium]
MIYSLSLQTVGLLVGALLVAGHLIALLHARGVQQLLRALPRSRGAGVVLLTLAAAWAFGLVAQIDLGEFTSYRQVFLGVIAAGYVLTLVFVPEFLAVRALGMLCLLAAEPLLEAAFLQQQQSRLLLTVIAYVWAVLGIFWVGKPYLLRDQVAWASASPWRWRAAALGGVLYGAVLLAAAFTQYGA